MSYAKYLTVLLIYENYHLQASLALRLCEIQICIIKICISQSYLFKYTLFKCKLATTDGRLGQEVHDYDPHTENDDEFTASNNNKSTDILTCLILEKYPHFVIIHIWTSNYSLNISVMLQT